MNQVKDVVNFNLVANVTKFLYRSLYLILAAALASAALVCAAPAHAQGQLPHPPLALKMHHSQHQLQHLLPKMQSRLPRSLMGPT